MEYLKLAPDIDSDPAIEEAGWVGARAYELLLKVSALKDLRGRIPPPLQRSDWLLRRWNLHEESWPGLVPADVLAAGLRRLLAVGLVVRDGEDLVIVGWEKFYRPSKSNAERQRDFRQKDRNDRNESNAAPLRSNAGNGRNESNATPPTHSTHSTPPTQTEAGGSDAGNPVVSTGGLKAPDSLLAEMVPGRRAEDRPGENLRERMERAWFEETGQAYRWRSADDYALRDVLELAHGDWGEVERVWRNAARAAFPKCLNVASLARHWNPYANESQPKKPQPGGGATAPMKHLG